MPLIFLHISKTGGTTLNRIVEKQFKQKDIYHIRSIDRSFEKGILKFINFEDKDKIKLLNGHQGYGLHKYFEADSIYFTMLRNPVSRIISNYFHIRRDPPHRFYSEAIKYNLHEFIKNRISPIENENDMTRRLSGMEDPAKVADGIGEIVTMEHYDAAIKNIEQKFIFVGLTEFFDQSLLLLKKKLGWKNIFYVKQNVGLNKPKQNSIEPVTLELINKYNKYDIDLYNFCRKKLLDQIKIYITNEELEKYRVLNKYYSYLPNFYKKIKNVLNEFFDDDK